MPTVEDVKDLSDKVQGVDSRVSNLEGGYEHRATKSDVYAVKADLKDVENRLFMRLGLLIVVVGAVVVIAQRL